MSVVSARRWLLVVLWLVVAALCLFPADALAAGNDVGKNVSGLLKQYAGELYGGIVAIFSLVFLVNRRYTELAVFLFGDRRGVDGVRARRDRQGRRSYRPSGLRVNREGVMVNE